MHMYVGSQWFTIPHHVVLWLLNDPLPQQYQSYARYVVVADENYFATLISNSPYCANIVRKKNLFLLFDKWENELSTVHLRDQRKCLSPDPDHCGRSPSTLTSKFKNLLEVSHALFARKFDPNDIESLSLLSTIDSWRNHTLLEARSSTFGDIGKKMMIRFSGLRQDDHQVKATHDGDASITDNSTIRDKKFAEVETDNTGEEANLHKSRVYYTRQEITDFCWEIGNKGDPITLNLCNASEPAQWFKLGTSFKLHLHPYDSISLHIIV
jgi:Core-2/I-Branching enzyme